MEIFTDPPSRTQPTRLPPTSSTLNAMSVRAPASTLSTRSSGPWTAAASRSPIAALAQRPQHVGQRLLDGGIAQCHRPRQRLEAALPVRRHSRRLRRPVDQSEGPQAFQVLRLERARKRLAVGHAPERDLFAGREEGRLGQRDLLCVSRNDAACVQPTFFSFSAATLPLRGSDTSSISTLWPSTSRSGPARSTALT